MLCFLCKKTNKIEYLRCFIFDLIAIKNFLMPVTFHNLIILFARIWPDSLEWPCSTILQANKSYFSKCQELIMKQGDLAYSAFNPMLCAIIFIVKNHISNVDGLSTYCSGSNENDNSNFYLYVII
jgi:hypothetical protein